MEKKRLMQNIAIIVLAVAIIAMSVGYALYSDSLKIEGEVKVQSAKWSVHFDNLGTATTTIPDDEKATRITAPQLDTDQLNLTFAVAMGLNDTYDFEVDVVNDGTFDAELDSYTFIAKKDGTQLSAGINDTTYTSTENDLTLTYSVKWKDQDASKTFGDNDYKSLTKKDGSKDTRTLQVSVKTESPTEHDEDASGAVVLGEDATYVFTLTMNYSQAA